MHSSRVFLAAALFSAAAPSQVRFNRDIRPIMAETCFRCHGPDKSSRMAGMRLDLRDEALKPNRNGTAPIVPGDPAKSAIIARVFDTGARIMPPPFAHKELSAAQKDTIRKWVAEGAVYEGHWAHQPIQRPAVDTGAAKLNPIDAFVRERLTRENLNPSPEADRRTLIRRLSLDLTGIPPTPEEIAAFQKDTSPTAYEKLVDRLLASPRYAEQQTMRWLDVVRYADTCGFHGDNAFPAWPYRDYVLRAFRDNKPFDQFTREQLAGDLLPNPTIEQRVASAYNRLNRTSAEGGLQPKEYLAKYGADRVRTVAAVWLGGTLGCAECHDHKFDPFTARDFYSMKAFFADIKETGLVPDRGKAAWGAQLSLPGPGQKERLDELTRTLEAAKSRLVGQALPPANHSFSPLDGGPDPKRPEWEKQLLAAHAAGDLAWRMQRPLTATTAHGAVLTIYNDKDVEYTSYEGGTTKGDRVPGNGLVIASGPNPDNETYTVTIQPGAGVWKQFGLEVVMDEGLPGLRVARGADRLIITELEVETPGRKVPFITGMANLSNQASEYLPAGAIDGDPKTGWAINAYNDTTKAFLALRFAQPLETTAATTLTVRIRQDSEFRRATLGRFRLALSPNENSWPTAEKGKEIPQPVLTALRLSEDKRTTAQKDAVAAHYQWASPEAQPELAAIAKAELAAAMYEAAIPRVMVSEAVPPADTRILGRGNWMDEAGEIVTPAVPAFLGKLDTGGRRANRLDLANWLVSPGNPLTARVTVNRIWRQFFGIGLSKVLDDLGSQGEWPTHPELLDWLASEFVQPAYQATGTHAWDTKHIIRTIVMSQTYRQSSMSSPAIDERDPDNRLLSHQSRFRVEAEVVRDIALSVSGLLVEKFGGPSVKPVEPDGYLATLNFPKREYAASRGDDLYRRGLYTFWQRAFLHPSLLTFDAPTREECTVNRVNSNTPLQALELLNDPIYVEAARVFAQNILQHRGDWNVRVDWAFERAAGRTPMPEERTALRTLYAKTLASFQRSPADASALTHEGDAPASKLPEVELAAMTTVARAILNMHETITRN